MKIKKFLALALAAVMAVTMLTACSSSGVSGSLSNSQVNSLLEGVGSDITVNNDSSLNNAVRNAARDVASTGSINGVDKSIRNTMRWRAQDVISSLVQQFLQGLGFIGPNVTTGLTSVVKETDLKANTGSGGLFSGIDKVAKLAPINTPEKYAAAMVLAVDGTVGKVSDLTENRIGMSYNVSGTKATAPDGTVYWIFAAQVRVSA